MIKYLIIIIAGIVLIWLSIVVVRSLDPQREPQETDDEFVTAIQNRPMNPGGSVEPEMVTVMLDDRVYHKPDCGWIGSNSK